MNARVLEAELLDRCCAVAMGKLGYARDGREANVFLLASMVLQSRLAKESRLLKSVSDDYFSTRPDEKLSVHDVLRNAWVQSLPRLRDMLTAQLGHLVA